MLRGRNSQGSVGFIHSLPGPRLCAALVSLLQLMTIVTTPLQSVLAGQMRQVGACMVIVVAGLLGVYIK